MDSDTTVYWEPNHWDSYSSHCMDGINATTGACNEVPEADWSGATPSLLPFILVLGGGVILLFVMAVVAYEFRPFGRPDRLSPEQRDRRIQELERELGIGVEDTFVKGHSPFCPKISPSYTGVECWCRSNRYRVGGRTAVDEARTALWVWQNIDARIDRLPNRENECEYANDY